MPTPTPTPGPTTVCPPHPDRRFTRHRERRNNTRTRVARVRLHLRRGLRLNLDAEPGAGVRALAQTARREARVPYLRGGLAPRLIRKAQPLQSRSLTAWLTVCMLAVPLQSPAWLKLREANG